MDLSKKSVLVVDDTEIQRDMLCQLLRKMGVGQIHAAKDGVEGIRYARYYKPDLVLLDLNMPQVDGFTACQKIRLFADKTTMPIIVITGEEKDNNLERIYALGANDYFEKPFNMAEIKNRIRFYIEYCHSLKEYEFLQQALQHDFDLAKDLQDSVLPQPDRVSAELVRVSNLDFYAYCRSEGPGGDSWGMHLCERDVPFFYILDVTGHGINAAINNSFINSLAISILNDPGLETSSEILPESFLNKLNKKICENVQYGTFCAGACFAIDGDHIYYAGTSMPDLKIFQQEQTQIVNYTAKGLPLGVSEDNFSPSCDRIAFQKGDMFLALSDGLIESMSQKHKSDMHKYGHFLPGERLLNMCLKDNQSQNCKDFIDMMLQQYNNGQYDLTSDDITVLAFRKL